MHRTIGRLALVSVLVSLPAVAGAAEPETGAATASASAPPAATLPAPKEAVEPPKGADYTVPMMITDLALTGAFAGSWTLGRAEALSPGVAFGGAAASYGAFVLSGALYHQAFDLQKKTGLSIVVRVLAPLTFGTAVAANVYNTENAACRRKGIPSAECDHDGAQTGALVGALIGMLGATVAEATILVPDGRKPPPTVRRSAISFAPSVAPTQGGAQVGVAAVF